MRLTLVHLVTACDETSDISCILSMTVSSNPVVRPSRSEAQCFWQDGQLLHVDSNLGSA